MRFGQRVECDKAITDIAPITLSKYDGVSCEECEVDKKAIRTIRKDFVRYFLATWNKWLSARLSEDYTDFLSWHSNRKLRAGIVEALIAHWPRFPCSPRISTHARDTNAPSRVMLVGSGADELVEVSAIASSQARGESGEGPKSEPMLTVPAEVMSSNVRCGWDACVVGWTVSDLQNEFVPVGVATDHVTESKVVPDA